jgi:hypothetical protein
MSGHKGQKRLNLLPITIKFSPIFVWEAISTQPSTLFATITNFVDNFIRRGVEYPRTRSQARGGALGRLNSYAKDGGVETSPVQNEKSPTDFFLLDRRYLAALRRGIFILHPVRLFRLALCIYAGPALPAPTLEIPAGLPYSW